MVPGERERERVGMNGKGLCPSAPSLWGGTVWVGSVGGCASSVGGVGHDCACVGLRGVLTREPCAGTRAMDY